MVRTRSGLMRTPVCVMLLVLLILTTQPVLAKDPPLSVTVLASTSLTNVMTDLARLYSRQSNTTVQVTFGSPAELFSSIEAGEPADMYISESPELFTSLKRQGLIDVFNLSTLASNRLVLVAATDSHLNKKIPDGQSPAEIMAHITEHTLLVMGDPDTVSVASFGKEAIENLGPGYWKKVEPFLIRTESARSALYLIAKGKGAGIVYSTDAYNNPEVNILTTFPADLHSAIVYQAAVVAGEHMPTARDFITFLKSDEARTVFDKYGFPRL